MNVLLIGSGGREHALGWKLSQSPGLDKLYCAPGNPGIAEVAELVALNVADHDATIAFCRAHAVELVAIGPEAPLVAGLGDALRRAGLLVFGPDAGAARLEGSKGFTKELCAAQGIPTARFVRARSDVDARNACERFGYPVVVKADGLAAGKGVTVAQTPQEAEDAIADLFRDGAAEALVEEFLHGEEVSLFVLTDGVTVLPLGAAQDHKRVGEGDTGPNTGGMGAYSPAPVLTPALEARALAEIVEPTVRAMAAAGTSFSGVLYAGLMLTADGPKLIEYNARFGDPEAQVLMLRLADDLLELMLATARGRLAGRPAPDMADAAALGVVVAARGYPGAPAAGGEIGGIADAEAEGSKVFQAGTVSADGGLVAAGGRVLAVCALGADVAEARANAYRATARLRFADGFHRRDIGWREVERELARDRHATDGIDS